MRTLTLLLCLIAFAIADETNYWPCLKEVTVDAAFRYDGDLFLISGDEYMAIAPNGTQKYLRFRSGNTGVPRNMPVQAAIRRPHKPIMYYYVKDGAYSSNQTSQISVRRNFTEPRRFLQNGGPDAAAFKDRYYHIFKGCEYVKQRATLIHLGQSRNISDIHQSLHCDIDAAWTNDDRNEMTILKGNQIWTWAGNDVNGPFPFRSKYTIFSWCLKAYPDDRFQL